jgi:choline kinase
MRALILAAGEGSRLRPLTDNKPKALVELFNKSLLERQIETLNKGGIFDIAVATGHLGEQIRDLGLECFYNPKYSSTNMVNSLFNALPFIEKEGDLIISYGDIIYELDNLEKVISSNAQVSVMIDKQWLRYWQLRFPNPLSDAESLILNKDGTIKNLGQKTENYKDIQGQYTGLIKVRGDRLGRLISFYRNLKSAKGTNIKDFDNMFLTSFIQLLINASWEVRAVCVEGGWLEVDSLEDLRIYEELKNSKELDQYYKLDK